MNTATITELRKNIFSYVDQAIAYSQPLTISTKRGNAVLLSESDYNDLMETLTLLSIPVMRKEITEGLAAPLTECVSEDEVSW